MINQLLETIQITLSIASGMFLDRNYNKPKLTENRAQVNYSERVTGTNARAAIAATKFYVKANKFQNDNTRYVVDTEKEGSTRYATQQFYLSTSALTLIGNEYRQTPFILDENNLSQSIDGTRQYCYISNENAGQNIQEQAPTNWYITEGSTNPIVSPLPYIDTMWNWHYVDTLLCLQITPYNVQINTENRITYRISIDYGTYLQGLPNTSASLQTDVYTTTEQDWQNLIGIQNYQQNIPNLLNQYTGARAGYTYSKQTYTEQLELPTLSWKQQTITLQLTPNQTNYVIVDIKIVGTYGTGYDGNGWNRDYVYYQRVNSDDNVGFVSEFTVSGTMLIPEGDTEVVDIPGMMFDILGMPFTFISIAFNLTLFPGTPYQLNISNLFLSLLAIAVFMWIMSKILRR